MLGHRDPTNLGVAASPPLLTQEPDMRARIRLPGIGPDTDVELVALPVNPDDVVRVGVEDVWEVALVCARLVRLIQEGHAPDVGYLRCQPPLQVRLIVT